TRIAHAARSDAVGAVLDRGEPSPVVAATAGLRRDEVVANAAILLFGGIDTTDGMIANAMLHLLGDPGTLARARAGDDVLPGAVEESLRLEPAAASIDRYATAATHLGGAAIRAG